MFGLGGPDLHSKYDLLLLKAYLMLCKIKENMALLLERGRSPIYAGGAGEDGGLE